MARKAKKLKELRDSLEGHIIDEIEVRLNLQKGILPPWFKVSF